MDIVGGAVASLCEVLREAVVTTAGSHSVNLLFDHETDAVRVDVSPAGGDVTTTVQTPAPLWIRLPTWADRSELTVRGAANYKIPRDHVLVAEPPIGKPVRVSYPVPESEIALRHRTREIRARLRGDSVVAMDDFGAALTFFEPIGG